MRRGGTLLDHPVACLTLEVQDLGPAPDFLDLGGAERKTRNHSLVFLPWCRMNSGWILLTPIALFSLMH